jgi:hypothetical protein
MSFWMTRMEEFGLLPRLQKFDVPKATVYSLGCATHAKDQLAESGERQWETAFVEVDRLLHAFWKDYPRSLELEAVHALSPRAVTLLPREGVPDYRAPIRELLWSVAHALALAEKEKMDEDAVLVGEAAVWYAYQSVFALHHIQDGAFLGDEEIHLIEIRSAACLAEIQFQTDFFAMLEKTEGEPPTYRAILQGINRR